MWQFITEVEKKEQGFLVWKSLPMNNIKWAINDMIGMDDLRKEDGMDKILQLLKMFQQEKELEALSRQEEMEDDEEEQGEDDLANYEDECNLVGGFGDEEEEDEDDLVRLFLAEEIGVEGKGGELWFKNIKYDMLFKSKKSADGDEDSGELMGVIYQGEKEGVEEKIVPFMTLVHDNEGLEELVNGELKYKLYFEQGSVRKRETLKMEHVVEETEDKLLTKNKEDCMLVESKLVHSNEDDGGCNVKMECRDLYMMEDGFFFK